MWSRDSTELFYRNGNKMMAVSVGTDASPGIQSAQTLFEGEFWEGNQPQSFDVAEDGRFLMLRMADSAEWQRQINVVLNWFEELKERVPTGRQ